MIACRLEGRIDAAEDASPGMADRRELAMHRRRRPHHLAAEGGADRLMAEADAEDRDLVGGRRNQVEANAGLLWRAWARREHDRVRVGSDDRGARDLVV